MLRAPTPAADLPRFLSDLPAVQALTLLLLADSATARNTLTRYFHDWRLVDLSFDQEARLGLVMRGLAERDRAGELQLTAQGRRWIERYIGSC